MIGTPIGLMRAPRVRPVYRVRKAAIRRFAEVEIKEYYSEERRDSGRIPIEAEETPKALCGSTSAVFK